MEEARTGALGHFPGESSMEMEERDIEVLSSMFLETAAPMAVSGAAANVDETTTAGGPGIQNQVVSRAGAYVSNAGRGFGQLGPRNRWDRVVEAYAAEAELKYVDTGGQSVEVEPYHAADLVLASATKILRGKGVGARVGQRVSLQAIDLNWTLYSNPDAEGKQETLSRLVVFQWNTSTSDGEEAAAPTISMVVEGGNVLGAYSWANRGKYTVLMDETVCLTDYGYSSAFGSRRMDSFKGGSKLSGSDRRIVQYMEPDDGLNEGQFGVNHVYLCVLCDAHQYGDKVLLNYDMRTWYTDD